MFQRMLNRTANAGAQTQRGGAFLGLSMNFKSILMVVIVIAVLWQLAASMGWVEQGPLDLASSMWKRVAGSVRVESGQGGMPTSGPRITASGVALSGAVVSSNGATKSKAWTMAPENALVASGPKFGTTVVSTAGYEPLIKVGKL